MANSRTPVNLVALLATVLALQACDQKGPSASEQNAAQNSTPKSDPARSSVAQAKSPREVEDETVLAVSKSVRTAHLTELADACLAYHFRPNPSGSVYVVDVMENHRHSECGGDPQSQPRLFTIEVDARTQQMSTDKGSPGKFHPIGSPQP